VISIIIILIAFLLPALSRARTQAKRIICSAQLNQLGVAQLTYSAENRGQFIPTGWMQSAHIMAADASLECWFSPYSDLLLDRYIKDLRVMYCPLEDVDDPAHYWKAAWQTSYYGRLVMHRSSYISATTPRLDPRHNASATDGINYALYRTGRRNSQLMLLADRVRFFTPNQKWDCSDMNWRSHEPAGANVLHTDGSVYWIRFDQMQQRYAIAENYFPYYW
jgi:type II secretory pathway pseudopilin PulG